MDATVQETGKQSYKTPSRVQAWFLGRSRDRWKAKYKQLKADAKRLKNKVHDVTISREEWREEVRRLEAENAALREAKKKLSRA